MGSAPSQRSGQENAYWMGSRMSVTPSCAMIDPSVSSTSEWTTDCGWTTTSMADGGVPNSQCASMTSRPLFISVAESMVILRPIRQVGWLRAASTVTPARASAEQVPERPARGGQDQPAHFRRVAPVQALVDGVVLAVDRQHVDAVRPRQVHDQAAGHHQHFLVGERDALAGANRRDHRFERRGARRGAQHGVDVVARHQLDQGLRAGGAQLEVRRRRGRQLRPQLRAGGIAGQHRGPRPVALDLLRQGRGAAAGGQADHLQPIRVRVDHGQRAVPDRAGRAEDREAHRAAAIVAGPPSPAARRRRNSA